MKSPVFASLLLCALSSAAHASSVGTTIVGPDNYYYQHEGNSALGLFPAPQLSNRLQEVFASSLFSPYLPLGGWITGIAFRTDSATGTSFNTVFPDFQIDLSTTPKAVD